MRQRSAGANISGEPFSSWAGPVAVGAGLEYRELEGEILSDAGRTPCRTMPASAACPPAYVNRVGGWSTSNVLPTSGKYDVNEAYVETLVPLPRTLRSPARSISTGPFASPTTRRAATSKPGRWASRGARSTSLLLRGTRSRDIRAPGIGDLYTRDSQGPNSLVIDRVLPNAPSVSVPIILCG